jgi:hypothetical protein
MSQQPLDGADSWDSGTIPPKDPEPSVTYANKRQCPTCLGMLYWHSSNGWVCTSVNCTLPRTMCIVCGGSGVVPFNFGQV